ncbi:MarR family transcriptional regulator [Deltaproteobacteria bacterium Smac51]|nr:MarR family transcriptional regulator [Deltaproteobacteria bacterium Smac51]
MSKRTTPGICHCINIRRAANAVTDFYDSVLKPIEITANQYSLMSNIERGQPLSISALAANVGLERTTLARTLKPLFNNGWVEDIAPPGSRDRQLHLTASGLEKLSQARPLWNQAQKKIESTLGADGLRQLQSLLFLLENIQA